MKYQDEFSFQSQTLHIFSFRGILNFDAHLHEDYEVVYVISGRFEYTADGHTEILREGDFGLILPNQVHSCHCEEKVHVWFADFSADLVNTFTYDMRGKKGRTHRFNGNNTRAQELLAPYLSEFDECNEEQFIYSGRIDCKYDAQSVLYAIVSEFVWQVEIVPDDTPSDILISRVAKYIQDHFRENITLSSMATDLGYDRFYLSRLFNRVFRMNFRQYINSCRIAHAKQLMLETQNSITDIAGECGYQSIRTFNHAFYSLNGVTPSAFRSQSVQTDMRLVNVTDRVFMQPGISRNSTEASRQDSKK